MDHPPRSRLSQWLLFLAVAVVVLSSAHPAPAFPVRTAAGPQPPLVLQPDAANGTDTFLLSSHPTWNYGNNASLWVGHDAANGSVGRSLLAFNLGSLPANATILNATLSLSESQGNGGTVQVRRALAPWTEGSGGHGWTRVPIQVRETAGVNRTLEPVVVTLNFPPSSIVDPARDLRVYSGTMEVPSQVYAYTYSAGQVASARLVFDTSVKAYQTKWFNVTYSTNGTSVPVYRTRTWSSLWTFTPPGIPPTWGASGASVADIDGDGQLEIIFGTSDGWVYCLNATGGVKWGSHVSLAGNSIPFTPQIVDLDHNGKMSIIVETNDPSVARLNSTGNVKWDVPTSGVLFSIPTLVDVNGDRVPDILYGGNFVNLQAISGVDGSFIRSYPAGLAAYTATIADINGDGKPEILFGADDKSLHAYYLNGTSIWSKSSKIWSFLEGSVGIGDLNGNGTLSAVAGDDANNGAEIALRASDGATVWTNLVTGGYREGGQTLADLTGNGKLDVALGSKIGITSGPIFTLDGSTGGVLNTYLGGLVQAGSPAIVDLDKEGAPDIVFLQGTNLLVFNRTLSLLHSWTFTANSLNLRSQSQHVMTSPAVADLTGNGSLDIVVPTGTGVMAFGTGGLDHDWRTWGYNWNHTQRALDGNSPDGAPFLQVTVNAPQVYSATGASWNSRNGVTFWANPGGDFSVPEVNATGTVGWMAWNITRIVQDWHAGSFPNVGLFLTEADEFTGITHAFVSSDAATAALRPKLTIIYVLPYQDPTPRILGKIPDVTRAENSPPFSINLQSFAFDNDTPLTELRWNVTGYDPSIIQITGLNTPGNHILTLYPQTNAYGNQYVTYWLTDPQGHTARQQAWINITHVNVAPTFNPPATLFVRYNRTYTFDFGPYLADVDTPRTQLLLTTDDAAHTTVSGFNVSFLYPYSLLNQWVFVTLTVSDGQYAVSRVVAVKVTSDDPPVLNRPLPDVTMMEGQFLPGYFNLNDYFADPNGDALYYSTGYTHISVTIHNTTIPTAPHPVDFRSPMGWWGLENVTFRARDPTGAIAEDTIRVTVLHVDVPPTLGPVPDLRVHYDSPYSFNLEPYITDPDTPLAQLMVTVADPHAIVSGHLLTFLYPLAYNNTVQNVTIFLSDGSFTVNRTIRVAVGSDWPPVLRAKMPDVSFQEDTLLRNAYNLSYYFGDQDSSQLFWSSGNKSVLVTIRANGMVDLSALANWYGTERVTFRATDSQGALAEDSVWITVTPVDDAPFFLPVPLQYLSVTTAYLPLTNYLGDPDTNVTQLFLAATNSTHARVIGQGLLLNYSSDMTDFIQVVVSDGNLTNSTVIVVVVTLPPPTSTETIPGFLYWLPLPIAAAVLAAFLFYRRRQLEWAFLVTQDGLLVSSISRQGESTIDTDLLTGMLTTIMDFANKSFSEEGEERNLEGLELGEKRVAIVKGDLSYLAVLYRGRTPGSLTRIMHTLLAKIEAEHRDALGTIVDSSKLGDIPLLLQRLVTRGSLPFVSFDEAKKPAAARSNGL